MAVPSCRFVLSNVKESEIRDANGYSVFEPDVVLEIHGRNVFDPFGRQHVPAVIMHSREEWLQETRNLLRHVDQGLEDDEREVHRYPLLGTLCDICVTHPAATEVRVFIDWERKGRRDVGRVPLRDWVMAIAVVSRELSDLFRRYQPPLFEDSLFAKDELRLQEIESWLIAHEAD